MFEVLRACLPSQLPFVARNASLRFRRRRWQKLPPLGTIIFSDVGVGFLLALASPFGCFQKLCFFPPNHPWINRVFHDFHHPFWGLSPYFWKQPYFSNCILQVLGFQKSWPFLLFKNGNKKSPFFGLEPSTSFWGEKIGCSNPRGWERFLYLSGFRSPPYFGHKSDFFQEKWAWNESDANEEEVTKMIWWAKSWEKFGIFFTVMDSKPSAQILLMVQDFRKPFVPYF